MVWCLDDFSIYLPFALHFLKNLTEWWDVVVQISSILRSLSKDPTSWLLKFGREQASWSWDVPDFQFLRPKLRSSRWHAVPTWSTKAFDDAVGLCIGTQRQAVSVPQRCRSAREGRLAISGTCFFDHFRQHLQIQEVAEQLMDEALSAMLAASDDFALCSWLIWLLLLVS